MHIGENINKELRSQGRTVSWFARNLNVVRTNAYNIFTRSSIDTELLLRVSKILNHNFFKDLSDDFEDRSNKLKNKEIDYQIFIPPKKISTKVLKAP